VAAFSAYVGIRTADLPLSEAQPSGKGITAHSAYGAMRCGSSNLPASEITPHGSEKATAGVAAFSSSALRVSSFQNQTRFAGL